MTTLLHRCPVTRQLVQTWLADDGSKDGEDIYESVACMACRGVHLVNRKTGKALGDDKK